MRAIEVPSAARNRKDFDRGQPKGAKKGDNKGTGNKKEFQGQVLQGRQDGSHVERLQVRGHSKRAKKTWRRLGASIDLKALEIGAVQLPEGNRKIRMGIDSCAAVTVFPKTVADDHPMLQTRVTGRRQASFCRILVREKCRSSLKTSLSSR